ncbi:hypothetical protein ZIOFF_068111 [Zingiber officinale]|uniref:N-acetyltransferase ESCO zinc-finger domain-containing protein n=1 Tax=Zingiber officinale TaxID=94328 RepID=A0A8J5C7S4_ZINOF|nr:hypothetical protein ZIOFF_068111 [Zingiber officinale]
MLNKKRSYAQYHLELGQSDFLLRSCSVCGMMYAPGDESDQKLHGDFHKKYYEGIRFKGWRNERVISMPSGGNCRILLVLDGDSPSHKHKWLETILSNATRKKSGEDKQLIWSKMGLPSCHPLVFFAICTGASSDPILRVYSAKNVTEELEKAKKEFLRSHVVVKKSNKVFLPKVLDRYAKGICINCDNSTSFNRYASFNFLSANTFEETLHFCKLSFCSLKKRCISATTVLFIRKRLQRRKRFIFASFLSAV